MSPLTSLKTGARRRGGPPAAAAAPQRWPVNIGTAAGLAGVSARMVRHYELLGLLSRVARTDSGYRLYTESDVHALRFIRRARDLGFEIAEIAELLSLWHNHRRASATVRRLAQAHSQALAQRIEDMQAMKRTLDHLIHCCAGDDRPDCPILDDLATDERTPAAGARRRKDHGPH